MERRGLAISTIALLIAVAVSACGTSSSETEGAEQSQETTQEGLIVTPLDDDASDEGTSVAGEASDVAAAPLPDVSFTWWDGTPGTTADLIGQPTVINFFASTCPPCVTELPDFQTASEKYDGAVRFVGIAANDDRAAAQELVNDAGVTFELAEDPDNSMFVTLGGFVMPTTLFIDADGNIVHTQLGAMNLEMIEDAIQQTLDKEPTA